MLVTFGLIGIEIGAGAGDPVAVTARCTVGMVLLLLPLLCSCGGRGQREAM